MRCIMKMIPRVYQHDAPPGQRAEERYAPPAEAVCAHIEKRKGS